MGTQMDNWGEQRLAARGRRRGAIRAAMIVAAIAFGIFAPRLVPAGPAAQTVKLALVLAYSMAIAIGGGLAWCQTDEIERRIAINSFAAMGFASLFMTLVVILVAPILGIANPALTIWGICLAAGGLTYLFQRLRR
jgi:hypothetical protein